MATIQSLLSDNNTNITAKTAIDSITPSIDGAERVKIINELLSRGIAVSADTTALSALSGADYKQAIVEGNGVYKWLSTGTPNGTTIFAASGGGTWNLIFAGSSVAWDDITGKPSTFPPTVPIAATNITEDTTHRFATDSEKTTWNAKQDALVSGTNIKTINGSSVLGAGNLVVSGASALDDLTDVTITSVASGDTLEYNGSAFVNANKNFSELTGLIWDGSNKYKTSLSGNLALSLNSTKVAGLLVIEDNNSHTLTINGTSVPINATTPTVIGFTKANGIYYVIDKDGLTVQVAAADTTAPTVVSATAIDANTIRVVYSESMGAVTVAGHSFKQNGTPITPDSVSGATTTWDFVVSETMLGTDTLLRSYDSTTGATTDLAGNELASYTDQSVTNSIGGAIEINFDNGPDLLDTANVWTAPGVTGFGHGGLSAKKLPAGVAGIIYATYADANERNAVYGFRSVYVLPDLYDKVQWGVDIQPGGAIFRIDESNGGLAATGYTLTIGEHYGVKRDGSTLTLVTSFDEAIWTNRYTYVPSPEDETADKFIVVDILGGSSANPGQLTNPRGTNLVNV